MTTSPRAHLGSDRAEGDRYLTPTMVVPPYAHVGCRIETTDGARAVVRYVGPVEGTDGEWVGVEWDDPTRGKHDGSHGGERYFECVASSANGATPGSFVRPHKIRPSVTFREAIATKYLDGKVPVQGAKSTGGDVGDDGTNEEGMFVKSSNGQKIEIQLCLKKEEIDWLWNHGKHGEETEHGHCQTKEGEPHLGPEGLLVCQYCGPAGKLDTASCEPPERDLVCFYGCNIE